MKKIAIKNNKTLIIREATAEDAEDMIAFGKIVGDETENLTFDGSEFNYTIEEEIKVIEDHQNAPNKIFLLGTVDGELVAMSNVQSSHKRKIKHIGEFGISVLKKYWNQKIGFHIISYIISWAREGKIIRKMNLQVIEGNDAAIHLYKKLGFELEGKELRASFQQNQFMDAYRMGMLID